MWNDWNDTTSAAITYHITGRDGRPTPRQVMEALLHTRHPDYPRLYCDKIAGFRHSGDGVKATALYAVPDGEPDVPAVVDVFAAGRSAVVFCPSWHFSGHPPLG